VRQEITRTNRELGSLLSVAALPAAQVRERLASAETLVEYFGEGDRLFAFVVTKCGVKAVKLDGGAVARLARAYRAVLNERTSRDYLAASKRLHDAAFGPLLPHVGTGLLTVVPHGALHNVPFASLHDGRNFLVQQRDVRLLPSASVLPFLLRPADGSGLLVLGNPDLGNPQLDLPGAEQEARLLQRRVRGTQVLLRREASETALRRLGPKFKEIHFAMHGKFDAQNAMASGLYMARDAENDGILSVGELYDMQLNADLVVLSACETALGDVSHGDDMVGLTRGFLFAGTRSIVSSLWEVDDNATRDLMVAFYEQRGTHGKAGGLRQAQLAVMKKYPHPYYWAAFQMSGLS
jgi:CHAT domain-containing protein